MRRIHLAFLWTAKDCRKKVDPSFLTVSFL